MQMVALQASARSKELSARALRKTGQVPCVLYGNNVQNSTLQCEENAIRRAYEKAGESTLVELEVQGKKIPVLIHALALDPVTDRFEHVDFYAVDMTKQVETHVKIRLDGESPAVKNLAAILVTPLDRVTVRCLPSNLPREVTASLSTLVEIHDSLTVADITVPEGVTIIESPTTVIATVQEQRAEEVVVAPVAADAAATADGAVPAEGAAPADGATPGPEQAKAGKKDEE
jgi:large subunit ribosomal protein L25